MSSKLHQNGILTGCIDSFCLVCESHLRSEEDAASHIQKPIHAKNLNSCPYLQKFTNDHIRKVKKGYFCEFCNLLCPTAAKVGLHITESSHNDNKGVQFIKRLGNNILVFDNILITEQAWNGLILETCAVCNMEFNNLKLHIADQKHVLNLIQKKLEFNDGNTVYRKIDDTSFHCLICNSIFALKTVTAHYKDAIHETHVEKCRQFYQANFGNNENTKSVNGFQNGTDDSAKTPDQNGTSNNVKEKDSLNENNLDEELNKKKTKQKPKTVNNNNTSTDDSSCKNTIAKNVTCDKQQNLATDKTKSNQKEKKLAKNNTSTDDSSCKNTNAKNVTGDKQQNLATDKTKSGQKEKKLAKNQTENAKLVSKDDDQTKQNTKDTKTTEKIDKDKLFEHVTEFQKNGVNINFETETAFCKRCFESVDLDIEVIKLHIAEHKNNPKKEVTANTIHTMNENHSRTVLNSKEKDDHTVSKPAVNFDQNHNITKNKTREPEKEEEIIKIDLRKNTEDDIVESASNSAITRYVPGVAAAEPQKPKETTSKPAKTGSVNTNDPETFAKNNSITWNKGNGNAFCRICSKRIPAALQNMKEHIEGMPHKTKVARIAELERAAKFVPTKPMSKFIHQTSTVMNVRGVDDVILNDKYCLTRMSFFMITTHKRLRCQACEVNLNEHEVTRHVDGVFHERAMERTPVVTSLSSEFVREVRRDLYHCGFCNLIVGSWEDVQSHLQCSEHAQCQRAAAARLQNHLPGILSHRANRERLYRAAFLEHFWPFF